MTPPALGLLAAVVVVLLVGPLLYLLLPFAAQAWSDWRRDDSWAAKVRRYGAGDKRWSA